MTKQPHVPDILLERYVLNELDKKGMRQIKALAEEDRSVQKRLKEIIDSNKKILSRYPARVMTRNIETRLAAQEPSLESKRAGFFLRPLPLTGLAAACLVILAAVFILPLFMTSESMNLTLDNGSTRVKGSDLNYTEPSLAIFRKNFGQEEKLLDGSLVFTHDVIQIQYFAAGSNYGIIFSVDGKGTLTLHFPDNENGNTRLTQNKKVLLGSSFELDDAPSFERFFFITAGAPIDTRGILALVKKDLENSKLMLKNSLDLPQEYKQSTITLIKGER